MFGMYAQMFKQLFYQYDEFENVPTAKDIEEMKKEYELIQAKKSKMSSVARRELCRVYEELLKKGLT